MAYLGHEPAAEIRNLNCRRNSGTSSRGSQSVSGGKKAAETSTDCRNSQQRLGNRRQAKQQRPRRVAIVRHSRRVWQNVRQEHHLCSQWIMWLSHTCGGVLFISDRNT